MKTLTIIGRNISDIPTFYAEINRVFMAKEDWQLGESLDALNDLLYGGYGAIEGREKVRIVWQDVAASRAALGVETTRTFLARKLQRPAGFDVDAIGRQLDALDRGTGQTYFEIIVEIISDHRNIELVFA
ncbi:barstar (barnase inhibitor) [Sphingomonas sp. PP-CE-1A-559]|uniref:barstar family protein n=1 Tax=unclassified Sphingomonas TaxID=196159 RepID=UPI000E74E97D|nr:MULTISPECIES: barstar family protein [unclassified Sphingomonas]RKE50635.1 barstar (barnase inhibitor) [Sphingomonas sp. PP-CC-1A-547]TCM08932.1 barstar (barnase inhibitor) [Sphingomonas sp. PP-CC-3G-468]TCP93170.1 barstar (barnase inhibitor) [Sphingomonas sp. PP-CE-1A-559]